MSGEGREKRPPEAEVVERVGEKSKGKRVMELASEQTSKVPRGRFRLSVIGRQHMDLGGAEWKYMSISNMSLLEIHLCKIKAGQ